MPKTEITHLTHPHLFEGSYWRGYEPRSCFANEAEAAAARAEAPELWAPEPPAGPRPTSWAEALEALRAGRGGAPICGEDEVPF